MQRSDIVYAERVASFKAEISKARDCLNRARDGAPTDPVAKDTLSYTTRQLEHAFRYLNNAVEFWKGIEAATPADPEGDPEGDAKQVETIDSLLAQANTPETHPKKKKKDGH